MTAMETATRITGPCSCHEVYKSRGLIAPDCAFHDMAREIAEALEEARRDALEEAAKVADGMAINRARVSQAASYACQSIADRIRALSHPVKDTK